MGMSFISLDNYLIKLENDIQRDVETCCQINNFIKPIFHRILLVNLKISTQQNFLQFFYSDFFIFCIALILHKNINVKEFNNHNKVKKSLKESSIFS